MSPDTYADAAAWPVFIDIEGQYVESHGADAPPFIDPAHDSQVIIDAWATVYALAGLANR